VGGHLRLEVDGVFGSNPHGGEIVDDVLLDDGLRVDFLDLALEGLGREGVDVEFHVLPGGGLADVRFVDVDPHLQPRGIQYGHEVGHLEPRDDRLALLGRHVGDDPVDGGVDLRVGHPDLLLAKAGLDLLEIGPGDRHLCPVLVLEARENGLGRRKLALGLVDGILRRVLVFEQLALAVYTHPGVIEVGAGLANPLRVGFLDLGKRVLCRHESRLLLADLLPDLAVVDQGDELSRLDTVTHLDLHFLNPPRRLGADLDDGADLRLDDARFNEDSADAPLFHGPRFENLQSGFCEKRPVE